MKRLIVALLSPMLIAAQPPQDSGQPAGETSQTQIDEASQQGGLRTENQNEPSHSSKECDDLESYQSYELCHQWRSVKAAESSAEAAWVIGVSGLIISVLTLAAAVIAAWNAFRATQHTDSGNRITREIGEAQVRSYISVDEAQIRFGVGGEPMVTIGVKNSGQSPARQFRWKGHIIVNNIQDDWEWQTDFEWAPANKDISAGHKEEFVLTLLDGNAIPQGQLSDLLLQPNLRIRAVIAAVWVDVFDRTGTGEWLFEAMVPAGIDQDITLYPNAAA